MKKDLSFLRDYTWEEFYEEEAHVLAICMAMENRTDKMKSAIGINFKAFLLKIKDNFFTLYANKEDWLRISEFIFEKIITKKGWIDHIFKQIYKKAKVLISFSRKLKKKDFSRLNNRELFVLYKKFVNYFVDMRLYSSTPMNLEHKVPIFSSYIQKQLARYIETSSDEFNTAYSIMTTPLKYSYLKNKEIDLFKLGLKMKKSNFKDILTKFADKYVWLQYTFQGTPLTADDFKSELEKMVEKGIDFSENLIKVKNEKITLKAKQKSIIKKYKLPKELQRLFSYAQELVYLKFFRKGIFAESYYCSEFLLREIANRLKTSVEIVQGMFFYEVEDALLHSTFSEEQVKARIHDGCVLVYGGESSDLAEPYRAIALEHIIQPQEQESTNLKGQVAMIGKAVGIVRIVNNPQEMNKVQKGDILVSKLTSPNLLPAMKLAGAIVTDSGGLSCHAAIVARELKVPCVVGTTFATKMLKDGDRVEVDANRGTIMKV